MPLGGGAPCVGPGPLPGRQPLPHAHASMLCTGARIGRCKLWQDVAPRYESAPAGT
jgi:hypothetical protein